MGTKVSQLPAATTPLDPADTMVVVQSGVTKKVPVSAVGLANFTEGKSVAAPNASVPVVSLVATSTETSVDAALIPKGQGALVAAVPDATAAGGNKRGVRAVDLQLLRNNAAQVASGQWSGVLSGGYNTASAVYSVVAGGTTNVASATSSSVVGGYQNTASGTYAAIGGGITNTASANGSAVQGGESNTASGEYSFIPGGYNATTRGIYGCEASASGAFSAQGSAQRCRYVLRRQTTAVASAALSANGLAPAAATVPVLPNSSAYSFRVNLVARSATDSAAWVITGLISRGANAAATALVGTPVVSLVAASAGASGWAAAVTADATLGALQLAVSGSSVSTRWVADVETVEVVG